MFINYFSEMNPITSIFICMGLFIINIMSAFAVKIYIEKIYRREQKADLSLNKLRMINQYIKSVLLIITTLFASLAMHSIFVHYGKCGKFLTLLFPFVFMTISLLGDQLIYHEFIKNMRNSSETKTEKIITSLRSVGIVFIPIIAVITINIFLWKEISSRIDPSSLISMFMPIVPITIVYLLMPIFYKVMNKKSKLQDLNISSGVKMFLEKNKIKDVEIYECETSKSKLANAIVSGYFRKYIILSDYLIKNFELEEIKAILAHEICHIKKLHLWIRFFIGIFAYILLVGMGTVMDDYEAFFNYKIPIFLGVFIFLAVIIFYYGIAVVFMIRRQELQADRYVLEMGIHSEVMISALEKLARLNNSVISYGKFDQIFLTHPSYKTRIEKIKMFGK